MRLPGSAWIAVTAALVATGCSRHDPPSPDISGVWQLTQVVIDGVTYSPADNADDFDVTLVSTSGRGGQAIAGCDLVIFKVVSDGSKFRLKASEGVMFGCPHPADPDPLNGHYLDALQQVTGAVRTRHSLTLTGPQVTLRYREIDKT